MGCRYRQSRSAQPGGRVNIARVAIRNPRHQLSYRKGRQDRLKAELCGQVPGRVPLHSHNATYQSAYSQGWLSVTALDITRERCQPSTGEDHGSINHGRHRQNPA